MDLEVKPQPPLNLSRVIDGIGDFAEIRGLVQPQVVSAVVARVVRLEVIEDITELHCELQPNSLSNLNVLRQGCVHAPARQTSQVADASAAPSINPKNTTTKQIKDGRRISEHVYAFGIVGAYAV